MSRILQVKAFFIGLLFVGLVGAIPLTEASALVAETAAGSAAAPAPATIIGADTTWTLAGSPYNLTSGVVVLSGVTLTIEPGVEVRFGDGLAVQVDGTLIARGTASQPITFTTSRASPSAGSWGFIKFTDTSVDASFDPPEAGGNYTGGSILQYATVQYAGSSGDGAVWLDHAAPFIDHCAIRYNNQRGIYAYYSTGPRITNCTIANNTASSGGGIKAYDSTVTISGNTIAHNTASNDGGGVYVSGGTVTIAGNTIANNTASDGGGIFASGGTATISDNTIASNTASDDGGGVYASGSTATISDNTIASNTASDNGGGIYATSNTVRGNKVAGNTARYHAGIYGGATVMTNSIVRNTVSQGTGDRYGSVYFYGTTFGCNTVVSNTAPTWAGVRVSGYPTTFGHNNLYGNTSYELSNTNSYGATLFNATNNWWGVASDTGVEAEIYDFFDDATRGIVNYSPQLSSNETCAPPAPPTGLSATAGSGSVALSWLANPESDIAGYRVYYGETGFPYATVITVGNVLSYTVSPLTGATRYYFAVAAYDTGGDESWYSEEVSAIPGGETPPTPTATATATPTATPTATGTPTPSPTPTGTPHAGGATVTIGSTTTSPGSTFTVPVTAANITDPAGLGNYNFAINYNSSIVTMNLSCTAGTDPDFGAPLACNRQSGVSYVHDLVSIYPGPGGTFVLFYLRGTAIGSGGSSTPLSLTVTSFNNADGNPIPHTVVNGAVTIAEPTPTATPTPTPAPLRGDADGDGDVDIADLVLLGANFGLAAPPADSRADLNGDGVVNIFDLAVVGANFGRRS